MSADWTASARRRRFERRGALPAAADRPALRPVDPASPLIATPSRASGLSGQERLILDKLARGLSTEEIAVELFLSPHTVRTHIKNALRRLEARTRAHAVAIALTEGAIEP